MRGIRVFFILLGIFTAGMVGVYAAVSANTDIIVNEIGGYATSTHEWVEVWNKGTDPVDLTGWKFWEAATKHGVAAKLTDSVLAPGEYGAIVQDDAQFKRDYPNFAGSIFDSSWGSLSESGEEIGLIDANGVATEQFTYIPFSQYSLERINPFLSDYANANWREHPSSNTVGVQNSVLTLTGTSTIKNIENSSATTTEPVVETAVAVATSSFDSNLWNALRLNEIFPHPGSGPEWVELYNITSTSFDLGGGSLCDARSNNCTIAVTSGTIPANGWAVFYLNSSYLNNDGDTVILKNPAGEEVERMAYTGNLVPDTDQSLARASDSEDNWAITLTPTPNSANKISAPAISAPRASGGSGSIVGNSNLTSNTSLSSSPAIFYATTTSPLIITALYPYPPTDEDEYIAITNRNPQTVILDGWRVADIRTSYVLAGELKTGETLQINRVDSNIALNNTGAETVRLITPNNYIGDEARYSNPPKGARLERGGDGKFIAPDISTPENSPSAEKIKTIEPVWRISAPPFATINSETKFSAAGSADPRGGVWQMRWDFGDGSSAAGLSVSHSYAAPGAYTVWTFATSSAGTIGVSKNIISVFANGAAPNVVLNEILPNPVGLENNEFVELYNRGVSEINLSGWSIAVGSGRFVIPAGTNIPVGDYRVFYRSVTKLALANTGSEIALLTNIGGASDSVSIPALPVGTSLARVGDGWVQSASSTPGESNIVSVESAEKNVPKKTASAKTTVVVLAHLADATDLPSGQHAVVNGTVSVLPNTFNKKTFYVTDDTGSVEIYSYHGVFPPLALGNTVRILGTVGASSALPRIKIAAASAVQSTKKQSAIAPHPVALNEVTDDLQGAVVEARGEISSVKRGQFYLDDGAAELLVALKNPTLNANPKVGMKAVVKGMLVRGAGGMELWPRSAEDLVLTAGVNNTMPIANTGVPYSAITIAGGGLMAAAWRWRAALAEVVSKNLRRS